MQSQHQCSILPSLLQVLFKPKEVHLSMPISRPQFLTAETDLVTRLQLPACTRRKSNLFILQSNEAEQTALQALMSNQSKRSQPLKSACLLGTPLFEPATVHKNIHCRGWTYAQHAVGQELQYGWIICAYEGKCVEGSHILLSVPSGSNATCKYGGEGHYNTAFGWERKVRVYQDSVSPN